MAHAALDAPGTHRMCMSCLIDGRVEGRFHLIGLWWKDGSAGRAAYLRAADRLAKAVMLSRSVCRTVRGCSTVRGVFVEWLGVWHGKGLAR